MRKLLFRSRSGEGYPMVIAVTLCLLMLFMVIAEYFRVNIIVQGVRDAVQQAVIATVNENYDDVYHSVREGYAAGWFPEGDGEWFESIDAGDIYGNLSYILGLTTDGEGYMKYAGNELEYTLSDLSVQRHRLRPERGVSRNRHPPSGGPHPLCRTGAAACKCKSAGRSQVYTKVLVLLFSCSRLPKKAVVCSG